MTMEVDSRRNVLPERGPGESIGRGPTIPTIQTSVHSEGSPGDPMDVTPTNSTMGPPAQSSPDREQGGISHTTPPSSQETSNVVNGTAGPGGGAAAAVSAHQPKVVQTAFIHKLYNMLEDPNIQHLISWSSSNEGFVMSPSNEFSKVLAQYFKHTNISSFVRQLNMYGFHKVSDVFHTGSPESPLWEFKHGNGNFKRGDLVGLREIKRRASRHALIHRDSFSSGPKSSAPPAPGAPPEPSAPESSTDARLNNLEHNLYNLHSRLLQTEEANAFLTSRYHAMLEGLLRCHQWSHDLSHYVTTIAPDPETPVHRDASALRKEILRQIELLRTIEDQPEQIPSRHHFFSNLSLDGAPLSPRQAPADSPHRAQNPNIARQNYYRPPIPSHLTSLSPRRYGSVGTAQHAQNPSSLFRAAPPPLPAHSQHPLASVDPTPTNLPRRHTSADIRSHGWHPPNASPFASGQSSSHWPSSPSRTPIANARDDEDPQAVRNVLARYEIKPSTRSERDREHPGAHHHNGGGGGIFSNSRHTTPPLSSDTTPGTISMDSTWSFANATRRDGGAGGGGGGSTTTGWGGKIGAVSETPPGAGTRRSSMASNVHNLLNPAETVEEDDRGEAGGGAGGGGKRKRLA